MAMMKIYASFPLTATCKHGCFA